MIVRIFYNDINILQWHYRRDLIQQCGQNREPHSEPSYSVFLIYQNRSGRKAQVLSGVVAQAWLYCGRTFKRQAKCGKDVR